MAKLRPHTQHVVVNLKRLMEMHAKTQSDLARESGVSQRHISGILAGETGCSVEYAAMLAAPFGLEGWLLLVPDLPEDLLRSKSLCKLISAYLRASPENRAFIEQVAARESSRP